MKLFFKSGKLTLPQQVLKNKNDIEILKDKAFIVNPTGAYVEDKIYKKYDMVAYQENAYIYINDVESQGITPTNVDYWALYSSAQTGATGPQGPQGATGPQGPQGANGIGFNTATNINVINDAITVDNTGISLEQTTEVITQSNGTFEINTQSKLPIIGSESVVVDVAEDGEHAEIHLDADITTRLAKTLITPMSTPTATEIVAVDNTNSQKMLAIGDGLSVENGTLKASGGDGGKLYRHMINLSNTVQCEIITSSSELFTATTLSTFLKGLGFSLSSGASAIMYPTSIYRFNNTTFYHGISAVSTSDNQIQTRRYTLTSTDGVTTISTDNLQYTNVYDTVKEI